MIDWLTRTINPIAQMQPKLIRFLNGSMAGMLLAVAVALFIGSRAEADIILPHDPIFMLSIRHFSWILGGICLVVALFTLAGQPTFLRAMVLAWLATSLAVYRLAILWDGGHGLGGYLGNFAGSFGISVGTAATLAQVTLGYLIFGSYFMLVCLWRESRRSVNENQLNISCPACGGHVTFADKNLGQEIPCPHCGAAIVLRKPENLKMTCVLCGGHVAFPAHALGQKIQCPHCAKTITLLKPA
jgi:DNA-directed RNA polymerase subunit RPC12/RpoP